MKIGKITSVAVGTMGVGSGNNGLTFRVGKTPDPPSESMGWEVSEIEMWRNVKNGTFGAKVYTGEKILKFQAVNQPLTVEYSDPESTGG